MNASRGVDTSSPGLTKSQRELIAFLSEGHTSPAADRVNRWIACSPRYAAFVEQYKHKIRKKLRVTREPEAAADLLYELQLPYWLLQEPRFEVAYEPYSAGKIRGPDYAVTFRTNYTFNIEVTHTRGLQQTPAAEPGGEVLLDFRLVNVLCNKIRQLTQGSANLLVVVYSPFTDQPLDLAGHLAWIKVKAERGDPAFYTHQRFRDPADFFKYFLRLSGVAVHLLSDSQPTLFWTNPQARVSLIDPVVRILKEGIARMEA